MRHTGRAEADVEKDADRDFWLWRTTWHKDKAYGFGYGCRKDNRSIRLYTSNDGKRFETLWKGDIDKGYPNETSMVFLEDDTCYCLLRCGAPGRLGIAKPPYTQWQWKDLGVRIGGPHMIQLPDGRFVAAARTTRICCRPSCPAITPRRDHIEFHPTAAAAQTHPLAMSQASACTCSSSMFLLSASILIEGKTRRPS